MVTAFLWIGERRCTRADVMEGGRKLHYFVNYAGHLQRVVTELIFQDWLEFKYVIRTRGHEKKTLVKRDFIVFNNAVDTPFCFPQGNKNVTMDLFISYGICGSKRRIVYIINR